jgi:hypothetical protein
MKFKLIAITAVAVITACLILQHKSQLELRNNETILRGQDEQLAALRLENQRISNQLARAAEKPPEGSAAELTKLRNEAQTLRKQTNDLARQTKETRESPQLSPQPPAETHPPEYWQQLHQMAGAKPLDARNFASGMLNFASEHDGQFPTNFDQIASFFAKEGMAVSGTNQFDIVYQGSVSNLDGIPMGTVAVVRDQATWQGPDGKTMRVYGMADGSGQMVTSDDNFQSWEAKHIIAPPKSAH